DLARKTVFSLLALVALASVAFGTPRKRPTRTRTKPAASSSTKTGISSSSSKTGTSKTSSKARYSRYSRSYARRSSQSVPTPERYRDIQQALATKGYYKGDVNGTWGPDSVDALRRFQADQNLQVDGKIGSLSLIALGLGPKRMSAQTRPEQPAVPPSV